MKHQASSSKTDLRAVCRGRCFGVWCLKFGTSLELGNWCLVFRSVAAQKRRGARGRIFHHQACGRFPLPTTEEWGGSGSDGGCIKIRPSPGAERRCCLPFTG